MRSTRDPVSLALDSVIARFGSMVRAVGRQHRLSDADLDEVMQEVRIRLWRAHGEGDQISAVPTSYVYKTAMTAAMDLLRRRSAFQASDTLALDDDLDVESTAAGPEEELSASDLAAEVGRALDTIPASRRPVVRMHLAGYSREEIASMLRWSEPKTRNLLYRGLADLRERLSERGVRWEGSGK
ncbi:MAG TPA: sigma-70 family RNA polymerase sigma factor [Gemmatimonadaceae bacterium]|jgi:RNA polymerase sigma factor (sigma-70 family)|nr:sigma-70 family RNA polymerase sigma factor [Gemmatimonadaceae bacterium]